MQFIDLEGFKFFLLSAQYGTNQGYKKKRRIDKNFTIYTWLMLGCWDISFEYDLEMIPFVVLA